MGQTLELGKITKNTVTDYNIDAHVGLQIQKVKNFSNKYEHMSKTNIYYSHM